MEILLVDDNEIILEIEKSILEEFNLTVQTAGSGAQAVDMVRKNNFSLVLMDIQMPEMDGFTAAENIRWFNSDVPIYALSADTISPDNDAFVAAGMNGALKKPLEISVLTELFTSYNRQSVVDFPMEDVEDVIFDYDELLGLLGDERSVARILQEFLKNHGSDREKIEELVAVGDYIAAREILHDIIGISGNLCCKRLYEAAARFGGELKQEHSEGLAAFSGVLGQTLARLKAVYDEKSALTDSLPAPAEDVYSAWEDFAALAQEFDVRATELFEINAGGFRELLYGSDFDEISAYAANYDYLSIINKLEDIDV